MLRISSTKLGCIMYSVVIPILWGIIIARVSIQCVLMVRNVKNSLPTSHPLTNPYGLISFSEGDLDPTNLRKYSLWSQNFSRNSSKLKEVWVVTPTYCREEQLADLTQTAHALYPMRHFVRWLIFDEFEKCSYQNAKRIKDHLDSFNIPVRVERTNPFVLQKASKSVRRNSKTKGKGIMARRLAMQFLRKTKAQGVLYFADDDNTYDSEVFSQIRGVQKVGVMPVGAMYKIYLSTPIIDKNGAVVAFHDAFIRNRKFPMDFAGFAINLQLIHKNPRVQIKDVMSYLETYLLADLQVEQGDLEPLASHCTEILAWHTKTAPRVHSMSLSELVAAPLKNFYWNIKSGSGPFIPPSFLNGTNIPILLAKYGINSDSPS